MGDLATLITAIGSASAAVIGAIGALLVAVRRVSPKERTDAVANSSDAAQDEEIAELKAQLRKLTEHGEEAQ